MPTDVHPSRRTLLLGSAALFVVGTSASGRTIKGVLPWQPYAGSPPKQVLAGPWLFFTPEEGRMVETLIDRLIPSDANSPGARECGCAVFIDNQLAGAYGRSEALYMRPPFMPGTVRQGMQSDSTPASIYRVGLKALGVHLQKTKDGKGLASLEPQDVDALLSGLESGAIKLEGADGKTFFAQLLKDTKEGFFSDPVYGGNRNMAAWKMIGFPGARYDLRDWVLRHNEPYPYAPVGIATR